MYTLTTHVGEDDEMENVQLLQAWNESCSSVVLVYIRIQKYFQLQFPDFTIQFRITNTPKPATNRYLVIVVSEKKLFAVLVLWFPVLECLFIVSSLAKKKQMYFG